MAGKPCSNHSTYPMGGLSMSTPSSARQVWELSCPTVWGRTHPKVLSKGNIFAYTVIEELGPLPFRDSAKSLLATRWGKSKVFIRFFYGSGLDVGSFSLPIVHEVGFGLTAAVGRRKREEMKYPWMPMRQTPN